MKNMIASFLLFAVVAIEVQSSAIPMWEYLSKPEKVSLRFVGLFFICKIEIWNRFLVNLILC